MDRYNRCKHERMCTSVKFSTRVVRWMRPIQGTTGMNMSDLGKETLDRNELKVKDDALPNGTMKMVLTTGITVAKLVQMRWMQMYGDILRLLGVSQEMNKRWMISMNYK